MRIMTGFSVLPIEKMHTDGLSDARAACQVTVQDDFEVTSGLTGRNTAPGQ